MTSEHRGGVSQKGKADSMGGQAFQKRARHVFSVATTQLCCREKTVGWVWPIGHSFLIPELYYKANIML